MDEASRRLLDNLYRALDDAWHSLGTFDPDTIDAICRELDQVDHEIGHVLRDSRLCLDGRRAALGTVERRLSALLDEAVYRAKPSNALDV